MAANRKRLHPSASHRRPCLCRSHPTAEAEYHCETFSWFPLDEIFWKSAWVMLMSKCRFVTLTMNVSGVLDWCNRQARPHHRNRSAFNHLQPWKFGELIWVSHIVPLTLVSRTEPVWASCSFCMCNEILLGNVSVEVCVRFTALPEYESVHLCYSFHNQPSRWNNCTQTKAALQKIQHYLKFTKKGNENATHISALRSHVWSHRLTVTHENCKD